MYESVYNEVHLAEHEAKHGAVSILEAPLGWFYSPSTSPTVRFQGRDMITCRKILGQGYESRAGIWFTWRSTKQRTALFPPSKQIS